MVESKYRHSFDIIIAHTVMISQSFSGAFDPIKANPYRDLSEMEVKRTDEQQKDAAKTGIKALGQALRQMRKPRKRRN